MTFHLTAEMQFLTCERRNMWRTITICTLTILISLTLPTLTMGLDTDIEAHQGVITSIEISADGHEMVTACSDGIVLNWEMQSLASICRFKTERGEVNSAVFTGDGKSIVTASTSGSTEIWDAHFGKRLKTISTRDHNLPLRVVSIDGNSIELLGVTAKTIWKARDSDVTQLAEIDGSSVCFTNINADRTKIIVGTGDRAPKIFDLKTQKWLELGKTHPPKGISSAYGGSFSPNGSLVVTGSNTGDPIVWDANTGDALLELDGFYGVASAVRFSDDGKQVIAAGSGTSLLAWSVRDGKVSNTFDRFECQLKAVAYIKDNTEIVAGGDDSRLGVWDVKSGKLLRIIGKKRDGF